MADIGCPCAIASSCTLKRSGRQPMARRNVCPWGGGHFTSHAALRYNSVIACNVARVGISARNKTDCGQMCNIRDIWDSDL